jgi:hypothetical protein
MYCEQIHVTYDNENDSSALNAIMEFWTKITPGILQLLSQTKVVRMQFNLKLKNNTLLSAFDSYLTLLILFEFNLNRIMTNFTKK